MYQFPFYLFQGLCSDPSDLVRNLKRTLFKFLELWINLVCSCLFLSFCNRNCAKWFDKLDIIFLDIKPSSMLFENIVSMSVTRVGVVIWGRNKFVYNESKNSLLPAFALYFSRSILKSSINIIVLSSVETFWNKSDI